MIGLLAKKIGMSQIFDKDGKQTAITVLEAGPCIVTKLRTADKDGYSAVQIGFEALKEQRASKPVLGQFKKSKLAALKVLREIRTNEVEGLEVGSELKVNNFEVGDYVDVEGVSIGRGFQGVVKRHNFKGGEAAHGAKFGREAGSTGQSATPARVQKGRRGPGQMGNKRVTVQNLQVVKVDEANNLLAVTGAVPGSETGYLVVKAALKRSKAAKWKVANPKQEEPKPEEKQEAKEEPKAEEKPEAKAETKPEAAKEAPPKESAPPKSEEKS